MSKNPTLLARVLKASQTRKAINDKRVPGPLTKKQREVLDFIKLHIAKFNFPPTCQEIADAFGYISNNAAHQHLCLMEKKGVIRRDANFSRAITIVEPA